MAKNAARFDCVTGKLDSLLVSFTTSADPFGLVFLPPLLELASTLPPGLFAFLVGLLYFVTFCNDPKKTSGVFFNSYICPNSFCLADITPQLCDSFGLTPSSCRANVSKLKSYGILAPVSMICNGLDSCPYSNPKGKYMLNPFLLAKGKTSGVLYARSLWFNSIELGKDPQAVAIRMAFSTYFQSMADELQRFRNQAEKFAKNAKNNDDHMNMPNGNEQEPSPFAASCDGVPIEPPPSDYDDDGEFFPF